MKPFFKKVKDVFRKTPDVYLGKEAVWIHQHCDGRYPVMVIKEILDYELAYFSKIGLADMTDEEIKDDLKYWNKYWENHKE